MQYIHGELIEAVDRLFDCPESTRREEFERWWTTLIRFLQGPRGRAFCALRPCAANGLGIDAVEKVEVQRLLTLSKWIRRQPLPAGRTVKAVARLVWSLLLSAAADEDSQAAAEAQELAWSLVRPADPPASP